MRRLLHIQTDESGYIKAVTLDGEVLADVTEIQLSGEARQPFFVADLTLTPIIIDVRADVKYVTLECSICGCRETHACNTEQAPDHDNTKGH